MSLKCWDVVRYDWVETQKHYIASTMRLRGHDGPLAVPQRVMLRLPKCFVVCWRKCCFPQSTCSFNHFLTIRMCAQLIFPGPPDSRFIRAETCMFMIKLPQYSSQQIMTERLLYAIHCREDPLSGWEFGFVYFAAYKCTLMLSLCTQESYFKNCVLKCVGTRFH